MRICVSGTSSQGKSTFISDFLKEYPTYITPKLTYRNKLKCKHSKKTTKDVQWMILNEMVDSLQKYSKEDQVIFDRSVIDNTVYTLWAYDKEGTTIDDAYVEKTLAVAKEAYKFLDIIFYIPLTKVATVDYDTKDFQKSKKQGLTDEVYREEIDNIFKAIKRDWDINAKSKFFDYTDKPAIIEIFGTPVERIQMTKLYLGSDGEPIGDVEQVQTEETIKETEMIKAQFGISDAATEAYKNPKGAKHK